MKLSLPFTIQLMFQLGAIVATVATDKDSTKKSYLPTTSKKNLRGTTTGSANHRNPHRALSIFSDALDAIVDIGTEIGEFVEDEAESAMDYAKCQPTSWRVKIDTKFDADGTHFGTNDKVKISFYGENGDQVGDTINAHGIEIKDWSIWVLGETPCSDNEIAAVKLEIEGEDALLIDRVRLSKKSYGTLYWVPVTTWEDNVCLSTDSGDDFANVEHRACVSQQTFYREEFV